MPLKVRSQKKEKAHVLVRRFIRQVQQSGVLLQARKIRFFERPKSRQAQKRMALRRQELKEKYEKLKKNAETENSTKFRKIFTRK